MRNKLLTIILYIFIIFIYFYYIIFYIFLYFIILLYYKLPQPQYTVTLWNPEEDEWRLFRARFTLNGKHVVGSGSTPKKAEHAAARKYLHNNFMSREISLQAEIFFFYLGTNCILNVMLIWM